MTDKNEKAYKELRKNNFLVSMQKVVVVEIPDEVGSFHKVAKILEKNKINIQDAYGFIIEKGEKACLILKVEETEKVEKILKDKGYRLIENF